MVNTTYWKSAVAGGAIMGLGFVIGGFCPGTSVCAASIGKIDAMLFIIGVFVGEFIMFEIFPFIKSFYYGGYMGKIKVYEFLGINQGLFVLLLILVAIAAFYVTALIEKKAKKIEY